jgi:hypothetical protein
MKHEDHSAMSEQVGDSERLSTPCDQAKAENETSTEKESSIATEIERFFNHVQSIGSSGPLTMLVMNASLKVAYKEYEEYVDQCETVSVGPPRKFKIPAERHHEYQRLETQLERTQIAVYVVPKSFVVALVSQFDSYLGGLMRAFFNLRPELLNASERVLTFKELKEFSSIDEARDFILEKEIETLLRKSHPEQFDWMENKFKIKLRDGLSSWPAFVEVTERRNLFVHCDGVISRQYMDVCSHYGVEGLTGLQVGNRLEVDFEYFLRAHQYILEIGLKLGHVLWRKLCPEQRRVADDNLSDICFGLLQESQYKLARNLLEFAVNDLKKHSSEVVRRIFIVNYAQAHKWLGNMPGCSATLDNEDWTACDDKFQIALAVLTDDFDRAVGLMKKIGPQGGIQKSSYRSWPVFQEFRKREDFRATYKEVFGEDYEKATTAASAPEVKEIPTNETIN